MVEHSQEFGPAEREIRESPQPPTLRTELLALYPQECFMSTPESADESGGTTADRVPCTAIEEHVDDKVDRVNNRIITEQFAVDATTGHARIIKRRCAGIQPDGTCGFNTDGFMPGVRVVTQGE